MFRTLANYFRGRTKSEDKKITPREAKELIEEYAPATAHVISDIDGSREEAWNIPLSELIKTARNYEGTPDMALLFGGKNGGRLQIYDGRSKKIYIELFTHYDKGEFPFSCSLFGSPSLSFDGNKTSIDFIVSS